MLDRADIDVVPISSDTLGCWFLPPVVPAVVIVRVAFPPDLPDEVHVARCRVREGQLVRVAPRSALAPAWHRRWVDEAGDLGLYFGMIAYALMLPVMFYRFIFAENIPVTAMPTLAILAAPASLSLTGYLSLADDPQPLPVILLMGQLEAWQIRQKLINQTYGLAVFELLVATAVAAYVIVRFGQFALMHWWMTPAQNSRDGQSD